METKLMLHRRFTLWIALALALHVGLAVPSANAQYDLRIGVIDFPSASMLAGARLAADHINDVGGVIGVDGVVFRLTVVDTPPDNMEIATANMKQASVFAVIGPDDDEILRRNITLLQAIQAPVFTPATSDSALLSEQSGRIYRSRAADSAQFSGLADYLANALAVQSISTIQLDTASTTRLISFANALARVGLRPSPLAFDLSRPNLRQLTASPTAPDALAIFGAPALAAQAIVQIRDAGYAGELIYSRAHAPEVAERVAADMLRGIISVSTWSYTLEDAASLEFTRAYARAFGRLPDARAAAGYDAIQLIAAAAAQGGDVYSVLSATSAFNGVQGELNPAGLPPSETSNNTVVARLNKYGVANVVARYPYRPVAAVPAQVAERTPTLTPATATPLPTATPTGYHLTIKSRVQNVRSGPGTEYEVIGQVIQGTQARVLGANIDHSWLVIDYRGQCGWLAAYLVDTFGDRHLVPVIQPPATPTPAPTDTPAPPQEPDLLVLEAYPARLAIGQANTVSVTILNQGLSPAGPFAVAATFQPGGQYAGVNLAGLSARQRMTAQLYPNLSGPSGPQSIVIVADLNQQVNEGAGEANNQAYVFSYMADRPVLAGGTWTTAAGTIDLDGDGNADLSWTGNDLAALGSAAFAAIDQFTALSQTHFDAISATPANSAIAGADQLANRVFALRTADGHRGVMQVTQVARNGPITIDYRIYR